MGCCISSDSSNYSTQSRSSHRKRPSAYIVSSNGELRQFPVPITVAEVLQSETITDNFFLCNSDRLYFNEFIPALNGQEELNPGQIYFILPTTRLQQRLIASDMAALAVKASVALEQISRRSKSRKSRISPALVVEEDFETNYEINQTKISSTGYYNNNKESSKGTTAGLGVSKSGSSMKLSKHSSRRAKLAVKSFRIKLNTIYEGSVTVRSEAF